MEKMSQAMENMRMLVGIEVEDDQQQADEESSFAFMDDSNRNCTLSTKQVFINVPWWYLAFYKMINPFFTQRTKSKFVFAGSSRTSETLFKYISPELVPLQYGGLSRDGEQQFTAGDSITEEIIKLSCEHTIELPAPEACTLIWEARVVGCEVSYGAEFVPSAEDGYTVIVQKSRKVTESSDGSVISGRFKCGEAGKVVLTFFNQTSKKKVLYRFKSD